MKPRIEPAKPRGSWAAMLTWRTALLAGVVILALAVLMPTLRVYFTQQEELSELRAELNQARAEVDDLEAQVARWDDPAFIVAQARERLAYVFPGETPYRVIDPEFVTTHAEGSPASDRATEAVADGVWYEVMWDSIMVAGDGEPVEVEEEEVDVDVDDPEQLTDVDFGG
jgi:cell division protein FtsB